nr:hypothetical protein [Parvibaculum sp.]
MNRCHPLDGFDLHNNSSFDKQVNSQAIRKCHFIVVEGDELLLLYL